MCNFLAIKNRAIREDYVKENQIASYSIVVTEAFFVFGMIIVLLYMQVCSLDLLLRGISTFEKSMFHVKHCYSTKAGHKIMFHVKHFATIY